MAVRLACTIMPYAWGSRSALAKLTGRPVPSPEPEAEMWMGAHPVAPSRLVSQGIERSLVDAIADDPRGMLGGDVVSTFGPRLPFLLKILAAAEPLSLQAHPTAAQAAAGFADEEKRGVPLTAPFRNYKDPSHKPELICALEPFDALCGFRAAADTVRLFDALEVPELARALAPLRSSPDSAGLRATFEALMTAPDAERTGMAEATTRACARPGPFEAERGWALEIAKLYPGDVGVVVALMLNLVRLEAGEAIYLGAGNLHAYLRGTGVEIMASSDNVLRGGLTKKHVDVPELLRVLDFQDGPVAKTAPRAVDGVERAYVTPAAEFLLSVLDVTGAVERTTRGPEILLAASGEVVVAREGADPVRLAPGGSCFVPAAARYRLDGRGTVYRARVNLGADLG